MTSTCRDPSLQQELLQHHKAICVKNQQFGDLIFQGSCNSVQGRFLVLDTCKGLRHKHVCMAQYEDLIMHAKKELAA